MTWLVTGIDGFAGSHFFSLLQSLNYDICGTTRKLDSIDNNRVFYLDIAIKDSIARIMKEINPNYLVLLAGFSSLRDSFIKPEECLKANYESTKYFLEIIRKQRMKTKVLTISSVMVYCPSNKVLTEESLICNTSPYAESKIKQEQLIKNFPDISIISCRSFNHTGPNQSDKFIIPKIAKAFACSETKMVDLELGDIDSRRDYLDVRDVCEAYRILLECPTNYNIYNVCSSKCWSIKDIIEFLERESGKKAIITYSRDYENERKKSVGSNRRICSDTRWKPQISFQQTVRDVYHYWMNKKNEGIDLKLQ